MLSSTRIVRLIPGALFAAFLFLSVPAHAQQTSAPATLPPIEAPPGADNSVATPLSPAPASDPARERMMRSLIRQRATQRQKQIVSDSQQLLDLAKELKTAVDKSNKDELSLDVVNYATQIEKLAKSVRDKMRDGE